jgi:hypothetical protein
MAVVPAGPCAGEIRHNHLSTNKYDISPSNHQIKRLQARKTHYDGIRSPWLVCLPRGGLVGAIVRPGEYTQRWNRTSGGQTTQLTLEAEFLDRPST